MLALYLLFAAMDDDAKKFVCKVNIAPNTWFCSRQEGVLGAKPFALGITQAVDKKRTRMRASIILSWECFVCCVLCVGSSQA